MKKIISIINRCIFNSIEFLLNVDTAEEFNTSKLNKEMSALSEYKDGKQYSSLNYLYLYKISKMIPLGKNDVFYDLGCGLGRIIFFYSLFGLKKCIGVDLSEQYCKLAVENAKRLRFKRTPVEVRCNDVTKSDLSDATIVFMFNPFGAETMTKVIDSLADSIRTKPRKVTIVYYNDLYRESIQQNPRFVMRKEFTETHRSSIWECVP